VSRIRILSDTVANQIAAGEVVERPASVIKELLENALDAGASRIEIEIDGGGRDRMLVADDGSGLHEDDVSLAFTRHATSKLEGSEDLVRIATLGFRGEALPSIASVARLTLTTLRDGAELGTRIQISGGEVEAIDAVPFSRGTTVEVRDLFYNVPARRKFLRAASAETAACGQVVQRVALAHPEVHIVFSAGGKVRVRCPKAGGPRERIGQLFSVERAESLLEARVEEAGAEIYALADPPALHHASRGEQHVFVNGRPIADRGLSHAIQRAFDGLMQQRRFPGVFLYISLDSARVDVNVHPAKAEVRFADARSLQSLVVRALREALTRARYVPALEADARTDPRAAGVREAVADFFGERKPVERVYQLRREPAVGEAVQPAPPELAADRPLRVLGQFRSTFIVACDDDGLVLADQHTAHERILFERLAAAPSAAAVQPLLMPIAVELTASAVAVLEAGRDQLAELGVEIEPLGGASVAVRALPAGIDTGRARELLLECERSLGGGDAEGAIAARRQRLLATVACHAAVKVNMPLDRDRMEWIIEHLVKCDEPLRCPHGRATILRMDEDAIKRAFKRYW